MKKPTAAYIHIPFCSHICYYCDFAKVLLEGQPVDDYVEAVISEFERYEIPKLRTLYIGGGTPSVLSVKQMKRLLSGLTASLDLSKLEEFTIEANPGDLSEELIAVLKDSPVNRISLGVQSFNDKMLRRIGRTHSSRDVDLALERLKSAGFQNVTIDLIYGLPFQTLEDVKNDVDKFLSLDLPHVALYSLILEDHTRFMNMQRSGMLHLPNDDKNADMYEYIMGKLANSGYQHYEISNFSKPGFESKHNLTYWDNEEYYGIGAGASGYLDGVRYKNHGPVHHYLESENKRVSEEKLTKREQMEEEMFLGLRKANGVSIAKFDEKFALKFEQVYGKVFNDLQKTDLINFDGDRISLTERGFELGNEVFEQFLID
ncbi:MAG: radical SAM family heme chaperone HemW [Streptococcaceae bacterium]|jgi:oxygen-independent coproporphyrinogen-3 oxidase|nr:radical SAM family heme chaperone HemW [Streptococcaceae bacterium]